MKAEEFCKKAVFSKADKLTMINEVIDTILFQSISEKAIDESLLLDSLKILTLLKTDIEGTE